MQSQPENPKDRQGAKKVDISLFPPVALVHGSHAFMDGAVKYGPYNWRDNPVLARVYTAAAARHILAWQDGEEVSDVGVHHLGHAIACLAIILDAQAAGVLKDDRAPKGRAGPILATIEGQIAHRRAVDKPAP